MHSLWQQRAFHSQPDLVVVGAGIVGLFIALFHQRRHPKHRVMVLERAAFPDGATVRNAGFACFGSPSELLHDLDNEGETVALQRAEERWHGLLELRAELGDEGIGYEATGGHEAFVTGDALYPPVAEGFERLNDLMRPITGTTTFCWADDLIEHLGLGGVDHLARTEFEGAIDSAKLIRSLMQKAQEEGVLIRGNADVARIASDASHVDLILRDGTVITTERVAVATNGFTPALMPELDVVPARGQVLLTAPIPALRLRGTFHMNEGFYYFRDCDGGILLGGARHLDVEGERTMQEGLTSLIQSDLERLLRDLILPGQEFSIANRWSGTMAFGSAGKTPLVERITDRVAVAVRLGGMGVAIGIRVARRAAALLDEA